MTPALLSLFLLVTIASWGLKLLNLRHLRAHGRRVPPELQEVVEPAALGKIAAYTFDSSRLGFVRSALGTVLTVLFLFGGLLGWYDRFISSITGSFLLGGVLFFLILMWAETVIGIPFSLYRNFVIEARHGFNTMTVRTWVGDLLKSVLLSTLLGGAAIGGALALVQWSPERWWLWVWGFFLSVTVFLLYASPYLIEPLFFKFEPVPQEMEESVQSLMKQAGLRVSRVFQVDASRRSRHSNAYFTGIGRVKRIVLFDTLIRQMTLAEIRGILAHEVGHWKMKHVLKRIVVTQVVGLAAFHLAWRLVSAEALPSLVGLEEASFPARVVILGFLGSLVSVPFTPLNSYLSRRHEWAADRFGAKLTGRPSELASALAKLAAENLSNLHPHPLYAALYYSHPPVTERIRALRERPDAAR